MVEDDTTLLHGPGREPVTDHKFGDRLAALRKQRGLTQQAVADAAGAYVTPIRRYGGGTSQPTLDVLRTVALALSPSADSLLFDPDERGPANPSLRLRLEALDQLRRDHGRGQGSARSRRPAPPVSPARPSVKCPATRTARGCRRWRRAPLPRRVEPPLQ